MQSEIEEFLKKHYPREFLASEVADVMKISRSSAHRQLQKLVAKGRASVKDGKYVWSGVAYSPPRESVEAHVNNLSLMTGIPRSLIDEWVEDVVTRRKGGSEDASSGR